MKTAQWNRARWSVVAVAVVGLVLPTTMVAGAAETARMVDVALGPNGSLTGQLVDDAGNGVPGAPVEAIAAGERQAAAQTLTDNSGRFRLAGLRGGVYRVSTTQGGQLARLWANNTAPPAAGHEILMVAGRSAVRGQGSFGNMGTLTNLGLIGVSVTAVTLSAVTLGEINDIKHQLDNLPSS